MKEVKEIQFYDDTLLGVKDEFGQVWLAVRKTCRDIGLSDAQARRQVMNVQEDLVLSKGVTNLRHLTKGGEQDLLVIREELVTLWLAKLPLTPTMQRENPVTVTKLIRYQTEAQKVLHEYFMGTEEKKAEFFDGLGLQGEILDLKQEVKDLRDNVQTLIDNSTINKAQQNALYNLAKERICFLLGGKGSKEYKKYNKLYFQNLWGEIKRSFDCSGSYHDLNPKDFKAVKEFIPTWEFVG